MKIAELVELLRERGHVVAFAESCTGGMAAAEITSVPGSSDVFDRGFVTYSNAAKRDMLGVKAETLLQYGAVSKEIAAQMAEGALARSKATIAVAITGIAGPGGSERKPEGRVCFASAGPSGTHSETVEFGAIGRSNVRRSAMVHALSLLEDQAKHEPPKN